ncbi:MAG: SIS domain-containing protein [Candidatus Komeilibacteria bacterium]
MNKIEKNRAKVYSSIELIPAQIEQAWTMMAEAKIPSKYKKFSNIVVCGMGGSNIGFHLVRQALASKIEVPIFIHSDYKLPKFVNKDSLVILSSYSGNTEEVISCAKQVVANKYSGYIITGGGKLAKMTDKIPGEVFSTDFNPSDEPRWGLGYSIGSFLQLLNRLDVLSITDAQLMKANVSQPVNDFKALAKIMRNKMVVVMAAEHLIGNAHIFCNQLNETADNMAIWMALPELNHHFMEALSNPKEVVQKNMVVLFLNSDNYSSKIKKRIEITKKVLNKKKVKWLELSSGKKNALEDSLSTLQLLSYLCYHMSVVNKVDPIAIPTVDFFKAQLKKQ